jgi:hypothetical protein
MALLPLCIAGITMSTTGMCTQFFILGRSSWVVVSSGIPFEKAAGSPVRFDFSPMNNESRLLFTNSVADEKRVFYRYRLRQVAETPISQEDELG